MMRMLLTSDWHMDAVTAGVPRIGEFEAYLTAVVEAVKARRVDIVAVLGDFFDPGKMNGPELTARLLMAAVKLSESGAQKVLWIAGNHDVVETSDGFTTISALAVAIQGGFLDRTGCARNYVWEKPGVRDFEGYGVLGLPYRARLAQKPGEMEEALEAAAKLKGEGAPLIVLGHMTVPGASLGSESAEMARGRDLDIPLTQLAELEPVLVANGHYHQAQTVAGPGGIRVVIPGSPHRFTFGERNDADKGFVVLDIPGVHA